MNIYELSQEAEALRLAIEEQGGEITPEQLAQLEVNAANAAEKVDYYYKSLGTRRPWMKPSPPRSSACKPAGKRTPPTWTR